MSLWNAIMTIRNFLYYTMDMLNSYTFSMPWMPYGEFSLLDICVGFILLSMVINLFWKGARA